MGDGVGDGMRNAQDGNGCVGGALMHVRSCHDEQVGIAFVSRKSISLCIQWQYTVVYQHANRITQIALYNIQRTYPHGHRASSSKRDAPQ
jgi:hypothetical protein